MATGSYLSNYMCTVRKNPHESMAETHQILHACYAGFVDALQILEDEVCVAVDD
jgi:hypothetical protein